MSSELSPPPSPRSASTTRSSTSSPTDPSTAPSSPGPLVSGLDAPNPLELDTAGLATLRAGMSLVNLKSVSDSEITTLTEATPVPAHPIPPALYPRATAPSGPPTRAAYNRPPGQAAGKGLRLGVRGGPMGGELKIPPSIQAKMAAVRP